jgi:hypothetical protein
MNNLFIEGDYKNPTLDFKYSEGLIEIKGRSWPEHATNAYEEAFNWLEEYAKAPQAKTVFRVALEYFNTSSSKVVLDIMKRIEKMHKAGHDIKAEWYYENDDLDLQEEGETYAEMVDMPIEMIGVDEFDFKFV